MIDQQTYDDERRIRARDFAHAIDTWRSTAPDTPADREALAEVIRTAEDLEAWQRAREFHVLRAEVETLAANLIADIRTGSDAFAACSELGDAIADYVGHAPQTTDGARATTIISDETTDIPGDTYATIRITHDIIGNQFIADVKRGPHAIISGGSATGGMASAAAIRAMRAAGIVIPARVEDALAAVEAEADR